jgi:hypothetical protein
MNCLAHDTRGSQTAIPSEKNPGRAATGSIAVGSEMDWRPKTAKTG